MSTVQDRASKIQLMGFDVDGTLTDGGLYFGPSGEVFKRFSVFDGHGLRSLIDSGIQVAWITARQSDIVTQRAADLKIHHLIQASKDKVSAMEALKNSLDLDWSACGFFGDDWPDFPVLQEVGFAATTQTAPLRMRAQAHWVATRAAGHGAAREICDFICEHHPQGIRHG